MDNKTFYDRKYASFSSVPGFTHEERYCSRIILWMKKKKFWPVNENISYLDAGCGFGLKTYIFSKSFNRATKAKGIDISENVIRICNLLNDNPGALSFEMEDIKDIKEERFDLITAFGLSYFNTKDTDLLAARIAEIRTLLLKEGGILFITARTGNKGISDSGWNNLSRIEVKQLTSKLQRDNATHNVISPDRDMVYFGTGSIIQKLGSMRKLILNLPRDLFIIVRNG